MIVIVLDCGIGDGVAGRARELDLHDASHVQFRLWNVNVHYVFWERVGKTEKQSSATAGVRRASESEEYRVTSWAVSYLWLGTKVLYSRLPHTIENNRHNRICLHHRPCKRPSIYIPPSRLLAQCLPRGSPNEWLVLLYALCSSEPDAATPHVPALFPFSWVASAPSH